MKNRVLLLFIIIITIVVVITYANPINSINQIPSVNQKFTQNNQILTAQAVKSPHIEVPLKKTDDLTSSSQNPSDTNANEISIESASGYWYTTHGNAAVLDSEWANNCTSVGHNKFGAGFGIKGGRKIIIDIPISSIAQQSSTLPVKFRYVYVTFTTSPKARIYAVEVDLGSGGSIFYQPVSGWTGLTSQTKTLTLSKYFTIPKGSSVNIRLFCISSAPIGQNDQWIQPRSVGILI